MHELSSGYQPLVSCTMHWGPMAGKVANSDVEQAGCQP